MKEKRILGNKDSFAIQYELKDVFNQFINGKICYWIQGKQIGKYEEMLLSDILLFLPTIIKDSGNRIHEIFYDMEPRKLVYLLSGAAFLEDNVEVEKKANEEQWARFNLSIPLDVLGTVSLYQIDSIENTRLILIDDKGECFQAYIEKGCVDKVYLQLYNELIACC